MISCKEAGQFSLQREERPLGLKQSFQLQVHLLVCRFCRAFARQSKWINEMVHKLEPADRLSEDEKREMKQKIAARD